MTRFSDALLVLVLVPILCPEVFAMPRELSIVEARKLLTSLPEELSGKGRHDAVTVTRRGKPVLAILPWELYEAITETLEVMADEGLTSALKESIAEYKRGKVISWEKAKKELDL